MTPRSLYVHVPFCARRCFYCDFAVHAARQPPTGAWLEAVGQELELLAIERGWRAPVELQTLYVGGGTPSLLGSGAMQRLLAQLSSHAGLSPGAEWTGEANPESFSAELAMDWRAAGVNRISLGVQTFSVPALRWMGRLHGPEGSARAVLAARAARFDNLSLDLIFGLPERLERDWAGDLRHALELEPEHISLYGLTAEAGAPLGRRVTEGREALADDDRYADEYLLAHEQLVAAGYEHYEVSSFARPGFRSRHNGVYWTGNPYAALGPGAHTLYPPVRRWNLRDWDAYRRALQQGKLPVEDEEVVDQDAAALERVWLALRTVGGISLTPAAPEQLHLVANWAQRGWAVVRGASVQLTPEGWLLLDRLALEFAEARPVLANCS
ncbi:MAG: radical SAM family heme chaperone HemW [Gemmatimonadetes bacterium]|nr:radical SAM family heme chaperone HemW [Gemmatimonadota bacterium]